jgi:hypothetical protein
LLFGAVGTRERDGYAANKMKKKKKTSPTGVEYMIAH